MGIQIRKDQRVFSLDGTNSSYIFCVGKHGRVVHLYWGAKITDLNDFDIPMFKGISTFEGIEDILPEEFTAWGQLKYKEPSLKVSFKDGTRDLKLEFEGFQVSECNLSISFIDSFYKVKAEIIYEIFSEHDMIKRNVIFYNKEDEDVSIDIFYSGEWNLPGEDYWLTNVQGTWGNEGSRFREKVSRGKTVLESRRGITAHNHSPYFMLDRSASELTGDVYFGVLSYSGNFKLTIEHQAYRNTRILLGINDFDFTYAVPSQEKFETPSVYFGFTSKGFSGVSNTLNQFSLKHLLPESRREEIRPVLYNSWEAARFNVTEENQAKLAEKAANLGIELFVVDDGWFKNRNGSSAGLGDWYPDAKKFPHGLSPLIEKVKSLGMKFGIWLEPEMVNPDSYLYRIHPDWVYSFENREPTFSRNQLILNLTKADVRDYLIYAIDQLLCKHDISYVKWDMNRPFSEPGALNLPVQNREEIWLRHTRHVFELLTQLREKHPHVIWEGCASGGGRVNYEALQYFDQFWPSDNTDALDRLTIQHGYTMAYPIKAMGAWVTDSPNPYTKRQIPLHFRCNAAMMGVLGIGCSLEKLNAEETHMIKEKISFYKKNRRVIQEGHFYRLSYIGESDLHAVQYIKDQKSVVFIFKRGNNRLEKSYRLRLRGLKSGALYCIAINGEVVAIKMGDYLMNAGIELKLAGEYDSHVFEVFPKAGYLYNNAVKKPALF